MKTLVTGGAGFIGRALAEHLLKGGHQVVAVDNLENGSVGNVAAFRSDPGFRLVVGDVTSRETVARLFDERPDVCYHLAAQVKVTVSLTDPLETFRTNVTGTATILEEALKLKTRVVVASSCMVYDTAAPGGLITEEHPVNPASPYAASKLAADYLTLAYVKAFGLDACVCRPFNTYGPFQRGDAEGGVVSIFLDRKLKGQELQVYGDGEQTRDLTFVDDCVEFLYRASLSDKAVGKVLNAGTGQDVTINQLAATIGGDGIKIRHVPHPHPRSEIRKLACDYSRARALLSWEPRVDLEEGLFRTEQWLKSRSGLE